MLALPTLDPDLLNKVTLKATQGIGGSRDTYGKDAVVIFKTMDGRELHWSSPVTVLDAWSGTAEEQAASAMIPSILRRDFLNLCRMVASPGTQELCLEVL